MFHENTKKNLPFPFGICSTRATRFSQMRTVSDSCWAITSAFARLSSHRHHVHSGETISIKMLFVRLITVLKCSRSSLDLTNMLRHGTQRTDSMLRHWEIWIVFRLTHGWCQQNIVYFKQFIFECHHLPYTILTWLGAHCLSGDVVDGKNFRKWIKKFIDFALKLTPAQLPSVIIIIIDLQPKSMARLNCRFMR